VTSEGLYVAPRLPGQNCHDVLVGDGVSCRQLMRPARRQPNGDHVALSQSRSRMPLSSQHQFRSFSSHAAVPVLGNGVSIVVALRSQEQMIGAYAARIVAAMQNAKAVWNRSEMDHPGDAVRKPSTPHRATKVQCPVSAIGFRPSPFPATVALADVLREALCDRALNASHASHSTTSGQFQ
jgi:hypothetical protein